MDQIWIEKFPTRILERGRTYHQMGRVHRLTHRGQEVSAIVEGTGIYHPSVRFSRGIPGEAACDCHYASDGAWCKHIAALLFALEEVGYTPEADVLTWEDALAGLPPETLRVVLRNLAEQDTQLQELLLQLSELQKKETE